MKVWERLVSLLAGIILGVTGILFLLVASRQAGVIRNQLDHLTPSARWWALGVALVALTLTYFLFRMALRIRREEKTVIN